MSKEAPQPNPQAQAERPAEKSQPAQKPSGLEPGNGTAGAGNNSAYQTRYL